MNSYIGCFSATEVAEMIKNDINFETSRIKEMNRKGMLAEYKQYLISLKELLPNRINEQKKLIYNMEDELSKLLLSETQELAIIEIDKTIEKVESLLNGSKIIVI